LTRHDLKEQVEHDQFTDTVTKILDYVDTHRETVIRWSIVGLAVLIVAGAAIWYSSYRNGIRNQDLEAAFEVLDVPVGPANPANSSARTFATQDAKTKASIKALSDVVAKDGGSRQGRTAQYYRGTLEAQSGDTRGAESDLHAVATSSTECAPLAKIALAQLYAGENKTSQAQTLLRELVNRPTDLVSKAQAQILLARLDESTNPREAKKILDSLKNPAQDPAVSRAVEQMSAQLTK
jgi:hypothetical protein